ncbi:hypothetical protein DID78_05190 [Candidatus Marinamargulisbacteria bacterium SCGC AG-343-D04]|nr:hypothetical protein DID78_05190 [Candidatus Marinamargulisbacteria bacterium SCGC AG-343-D04]
MSGLTADGTASFRSTPRPRTPFPFSRADSISAFTTHTSPGSPDKKEERPGEGATKRKRRKSSFDPESDKHLPGSVNGAYRCEQRAKGPETFLESSLGCYLQEKLGLLKGYLEKTFQKQKEPCVYPEKLESTSCAVGALYVSIKGVQEEDFHKIEELLKNDTFIKVLNKRECGNGKEPGKRKYQGAGVDFHFDTARIFSSTSGDFGGEVGNPVCIVKIPYYPR